MAKIELIRDPHFAGDIALLGPRHGDGVYAVWQGVDSKADAAWSVAQWGLYRNTLQADTPREEVPGGYRCGNAAADITVCADGEYDIRLALRGSVEYEHARRSNELWPHLLLGQNVTEGQALSFDELSALRFRCRFRLEQCVDCMAPGEYTPSLHGVQVHQFFTVGKPGSGDFMWFGIPFFEQREPGLYPGYACIDGAGGEIEGFSGKLIRTCPQAWFTDRSAHSGEWLEYDIDLLPCLREAYDLAQSRGLLKGTAWSDLRITSTNIGYDLFGTFDCAVQLGDMYLTAVTAE